MFKSNQAPKKAAIIAGIPNLMSTLLLALFPTRKSLNILLKK